jgi:hypothetical protein
LLNQFKIRLVRAGQIVDDSQINESTAFTISIQNGDLSNLSITDTHNSALIDSISKENKSTLQDNLKPKKIN